MTENGRVLARYGVMGRGGVWQFSIEISNSNHSFILSKMIKYSNRTWLPNVYYLFAINAD